MANEEEYVMKICCIGGVDDLKTEYIRRFAELKFDTDYLPSLAVDITTKKITIDKEQVKVILVDTAGQEFFGKLRPSYYRGASAVIIFFSKGNRQSFVEVPEWKKEFEKYFSAPLPSAMIGFQAEAEEVTNEEAEKLAVQLNSTYFECNPTHGQEFIYILQFLGRIVITG